MSDIESPPPAAIPQPTPNLITSPDSSDVYHLFNIQGKPQPILVPVCLNQVELLMELDTGASLSLINEATYCMIFPDQQPSPTSVVFAPTLERMYQ